MKRTIPIILPALLLAVAGCGLGGGTEPEADLSLDVGPASVPSIPAIGSDAGLDVGTWNLEWFGDPGNGPRPEGRQLDQVWAVLDATEVDLWAVQEVVGPAHWGDLIEQLAGYDGVLATDPVVVDGVEYYSDFGGTEQKVGLIYPSGAVSVDSARVILTDHDYAFAGRPPVELHLTVGDSTPPYRLVVIVLHAKAGAGTDDRQRRAFASEALLAYLESRYPDVPVLVIGDFNDDIDTSITGDASPYQNFVDSAGYAFPTASLSAAGASSTILYDDMIDHHLATDELAAHYVDASAQVLAANTYLMAYAESTSDHLPVVARYAPPGGAVGPPARDYVHIALSWRGGTARTLTVYRDGAALVTTANDGAYIDSVLPDAGPVITYRVCETDTTNCSDEATVDIEEITS